MMNKHNKLDVLLARVFDLAQEGLREEIPSVEYERRRHDFVFHMTDWQTDLRELTELFDNPDGCNDEDACTSIMGFLYHVIPHLDAAGQLLLGEISNPFQEPVKSRKKMRKQRAPKVG